MISIEALISDLNTELQATKVIASSFNQQNLKTCYDRETYILSNCLNASQELIRYIDKHFHDSLSKLTKVDFSINAILCEIRKIQAGFEMGIDDTHKLSILYEDYNKSYFSPVLMSDYTPTDQVSSGLTSATTSIYYAKLFQHYAEEFILNDAISSRIIGKKYVPSSVIIDVAKETLTVLKGGVMVYCCEIFSPEMLKNYLYLRLLNDNIWEFIEFDDKGMNEYRLISEWKRYFIDIPPNG